jgi:hypothetical protein
MYVSSTAGKYVMSSTASASVGLRMANVVLLDDCTFTVVCMGRDTTAGTSGCCDHGQLLRHPSLLSVPCCIMVPPVWHLPSTLTTTASTRIKQGLVMLNGQTIVPLVSWYTSTNQGYYMRTYRRGEEVIYTKAALTLMIPERAIVAVYDSNAHLVMRCHAAYMNLFGTSKLIPGANYAVFTPQIRPLEQSLGIGKLSSWPESRAFGCRMICIT